MEINRKSRNLIIKIRLYVAFMNELIDQKNRINKLDVNGCDGNTDGQTDGRMPNLDHFLPKYAAYEKIRPRTEKL